MGEEGGGGRGEREEGRGGGVWDEIYSYVSVVELNRRSFSSCVDYVTCELYYGGGLGLGGRVQVMMLLLRNCWCWG